MVLNSLPFSMPTQAGTLNSGILLPGTSIFLLHGFPAGWDRCARLAQPLASHDDHVFADRDPGDRLHVLHPHRPPGHVVDLPRLLVDEVVVGLQAWVVDDVALV